MHDIYARLLQPEILPFIVAIVMSIVAGAVFIVRIIARHRERMALIGMGIDPDKKSDDSLHSRIGSFSYKS
jgi:hypothetical protein